jgi:UDP-glucuronate decarboxylase
LEVNWEAFRGKRVFLTGGSGFIGKWLIKRFIEKNQELNLDAQLYVLVRFESLHKLLMGLKEICPHSYSNTLIPILGDCVSFETAGPYDFFIHGAIPRGDMREWTDTHFETGVGDMAHVLSQAKKAGVKRFLFLSSGLVDTDIQPGDPRYLYYVTKLAQENLCTFFQKEMPAYIARIYSVLGYGMDSHYAAYQFIQQAIENREVTYTGTHPPKRSYVYVEHLADSIWNLLVMEKPPLRTHLLGQNIHLDVLASKIAAHFKVPFKTIDGPMVHDRYTLKHSSSYPGFEDAIAKTCEMYQRHYDQSLL